MMLTYLQPPPPPPQKNHMDRFVFFFVFFNNTTTRWGPTKSWLFQKKEFFPAGLPYSAVSI